MMLEYNSINTIVTQKKCVCIEMFELQRPKWQQ